MSIILDLVGQKFGKLEVISRSEKKDRQGTYWRCLCDCGTVCLKPSSSLRRGHVKSCGCIRGTHRLSRTRQYRIWYDMKRRCTDPSRVGYDNYGGRGISVCDGWETFEGFWEDMGSDYFENATLERRDVNGNYCHENCEWVLLSEQARNKRRYSNNKMGNSNMSIGYNRGIETLKVRIQDPSTSQRVVRTYSLNIRTKEEAIRLAESWLAEKRQEFGYKETHGV